MGLKLLAACGMQAHRPRVVALSAYNDKHYILSMLELGAAGYIVKDEAPQNILEAVHSVAKGESSG
jgi:DNA-binding NarL/FixJ family response regulator